MANPDEIFERELCSVADVPENGMKEMEVKVGEDKSFKVLLVRSAGNKFSCIGAKCTHYDLPLANGVVYKNRVRCFAHGACFNTETGDIEDYPGVDCLPKYDVHVSELTNKVSIRTTLRQLESKRRVRTDPRKTVASLRSTTRPSSAQILVRHLPSESAASAADTPPKCLVIGSGPAGLICADTLREFNKFSITMVTKDCHPPYDRTKLSKALDIKVQSVALRSEEFFRKNNIDYFMNQEVEKVDFEARKVHCSSGRVFDYDKLVIATGLVAARPGPAVLGRDFNGIFTIRTIDDSNRVVKYFQERMEALKSSGAPADQKLNMAIVGGSFIAMESVGYFADKANVTIMSRQKPFSSVFGPSVAAKVGRLHEKKGVKFHVSQNFDIVEYRDARENPSHLAAIKLADGSVLPCDICILAIGGAPATGFLKGSPLSMTPAGFVNVDKNMRTNLPDVYAVGDIAQFPRSCLAGPEDAAGTKDSATVNIAHWGVASGQGRTAALDLCGEGRPLRIVPFFWSMNFGKGIRYAGHCHKYDEVVFHEDETKANEFKFAAFYVVAGRVVAACTMDWDPVCAVFAELCYNNVVVRKEDVAGDPMNLKKLLV